MANKNPNAREVTSLPLLKGTVVLLAILLFFLALLFAVLYRAELVTLPEPLQKLLPGDAAREDPSASEPAFIASLTGIAPEPDGSEEKLLSLSDSSLTDLIAAARQPESVYQLFNVTWTAGEAYRTRQIYYVSVGDAERADVYENGRLVKLVISDGGRLYVRDDNGAHVYTGNAAASGRFSVQSEVGLPSLKRIQDAVAAAPAGSVTVRASTWSRSATVTVTYTDPASGTLESCEILPDCGAVVSVHSRAAESELPFYYLSTDTILLTLGDTGSNLFEIPALD